jgi:chromosomal replication initiation ATPase DnaA
MSSATGQNRCKLRRDHGQARGGQLVADPPGELLQGRGLFSTHSFEHWLNLANRREEILMTDTATAPARPRMAAPASAVAATTGAAFDEAIALTRRLKLPHIRQAMTGGHPDREGSAVAEVIRALLAEEAADRDAANLRTRRTRAAFPTGKTVHIWNEEASSIPIPTQSALRTLGWVGRREYLCVVGPSGTGKSHLSEALGQSAT